MNGKMMVGIIAVKSQIKLQQSVWFMSIPAK